MAESGELDVSSRENNDGIVILPGKSETDILGEHEQICIRRHTASFKEKMASSEPENIETLGASCTSFNITPTSCTSKVHVNLRNDFELGEEKIYRQSYSVPCFNDSVSEESIQPQNDLSSPDSRAKADTDGTGVNDQHDQSQSLPSLKNISLSEYFYTELTRGYLLEHEEAKFTEKRQKVYTFMKIPRELEKFLTFGFFQCVDAFLYIFTFLPLRFVMAFLKLCFRGCVATFIGVNGRVLEPAQICDLLKGVILVSSCLIMNYIDVSMMYHIVRGQAIIKLYIFFNMLEVADRLFSSFGQDILDSLFWTATEPRGRRREHIGVIPHLLLAILYVSLHSLLVLFQATTLNVAFNSHNKALLTIMMSNNFVELKGSVFKKFEKHNLFQMSCSDVRERFHFFILLAIVCMRNLTEFSWNMDHLWVLIPDVLMVLGMECLVDWVKHAFITKFNELPAEVYKDYTLSIAYDMAQSRQRNAFSDLLDVVSRRMGFIPLPLAVLLVRVLSQTLNITESFDIVLLALVFCCLITFKIFNSIVLLGLACDYIQESKDRTQQQQDEKRTADIVSPTGHKRSKSLVENLSTLEKSNKLPRKLEDDFPPSPGLLKQTSMNAKSMLSNSTVSLASVSLNEDFLKDTKKCSSDNSELKQRGKEKKDSPAVPLNEIDRYTMCNNRII